MTSDEFYATDVARVEDLEGRSVFIVSASDGSVRVIEDELILPS
jgi:hypothetical protein